MQVSHYRRLSVYNNEKSITIAAAKELSTLTAVMR
jgi:hypothetical protein